MFNTAVVARAIRLVPKDWYSHISLRFDFIFDASIWHIINYIHTYYNSNRSIYFLFRNSYNIKYIIQNTVIKFISPFKRYKHQYCKIIY
jgi:hypothetical protein